ncbi:MAG: 50S ribosomal protein L4 [Candidatus Micrarchaeaceae archaeon]
MHDVLQLDGSVKKSIELPKVFECEVNIPVMRRAANAEMTLKLQPQGHYVLAGMQTTAAYYGAMSSYRTGRHMGIAIRPREKLGGGVQGKVKRIPSAVKGKRAHPHMVEKRLVERINRKEYIRAMESAIASTKFEMHGAGVKSAPIILSDEIESIGKTKQLVAVLYKLGLGNYLEERSKPSLKKGLRRSARVRHFRKSLLFVFSNGAKAAKAARNIPGVAACTVSTLTVGALAPGGSAGRLSVWSESAINSISDAVSAYSLSAGKAKHGANNK